MRDERDPPSGTLGEPTDDGSVEETTGTTAGETDDGSVEESEVERLKRELEKERHARAQLLSERSKVEEQRRLNEERAHSTPPTGDPNQQQAQQNYRRLENAIAQVRQYAEANDPHSILQLAQLEAQQQQLREQERDRINARDELAFSRIGDAKAEAGAREYYATGDYRTPAAAMKAWRGDRSEEELDKVRKKEREIEVDEKRRKEGVVDTSVRGIGAAEVRQRRLSDTQYAARLRELDEAGDFVGKQKLVNSRR